MRKSLALVMLMLLCCAAFSAHARGTKKATPRRAQLNPTGTYVLNRRGGAGGVLRVARRPGGKIEFDIECNRGAPSYNSGAAGGTVALVNNKAVLVVDEYGERCEIVLAFRGSKAVVTQNGSAPDCGFGHAVYCDGTYTRKSRKTPKFDAEN